MDCVESKRKLLESMLLNVDEKPIDLPLRLLKEITKNFSNRKKIGSGGFADVYKGVLQNGTVAVKKLSQLAVIDEENFRKEVNSLKDVKHENIVRFLGYCSETQDELKIHEGNNVFAENRHRLLCFEFIPNGSLDKYIDEAPSGHDWSTSYKIIKGICKGLDYIHQKNIVHLDLKPANILLDHYMVPKIADFGVSKCFGENQTRAITSKPCGTVGYMAPELLHGGEVTTKSDIYSLGHIIIEMLTGHKGYATTDDVLEKWRARFKMSEGDKFLKHVRLCATIARKCIDIDRAKRPTVRHIIESLDEMDRKYGFTDFSSRATHGRKSLLDAEDIASNNILEDMLHDLSVEPTDLPLSLLNAITRDFSDDQKIGSGGFGDVYKGQLRNGTVAVKKLSETLAMDHKMFIREIACLMRVKHRNIVRFLGYCCDTQLLEAMEEKCNKVFPDVHHHRLLCFEFMPYGSLDKYIHDASTGLEWRTRYLIIRGICDGLNYLHENRIVHLDLKPSNILLDQYMVPKIADFGISRIFDEKLEAAVTSTIYRSWRYMAPEFLHGLITYKSDIYGLGCTIMEMLTGRKCYSAGIENVLESWHARFQTSQRDTWLLEHVRVCAEICTECINANPARRPTTHLIIERLDDLERRHGSIETTDEPAASSETNLDVHPLELRFPWDPNNRSKCTVTITNWTDHHVGVKITPEKIADDIIPFFSRSWVDTPFQRMEPHSTLTFDIAIMGMHHERPQESKLEVLMVLMETNERLETFLQSLGGGRLDKKGKDIEKRVKSFGGQVRRELLTAVTYDTVSCQQQTVKEVDQKILPALEFGCVRCMDVHPTETWVLLGHGGGLVSIWNYQTEVTEAHEYGPAGYCSAKFIAQEQWFASGHIGGWVHVCAYSTRDTVKKFQAHSDGFVTSLAVHPTMSFLLTSSTANHTPIKLWNWGQDWTCTREFLWNSGGVYNLTFHPTEANSFASFSTFDKKRECAIWNIRLSDPIAALEEDSVSFSPVGPCCFYTDDTGGEFLLTSTKRGSRSYIMIWDTRAEVVHHLLAVPGGCVLDVACHPTLPILASVTVDWDAMTQVYVSQICLWDARTYRLEKAVQLKECPVGSMVLTGTEELARLFVPVPTGILMTEIILPTLKRDQLNDCGTS